MNFDPKLLAREGNGAVQCTEAPDVCPPIATIIGPICHWWTCWDSPAHQEYTAHRDAVRALLIKLGCAVYSPHRAISGRWNPSLQKINDVAITSSTFLVNMTPKGIPAKGTDGEVVLAELLHIPILPAPPGTFLRLLAGEIIQRWGNQLAITSLDEI